MTTPIIPKALTILSKFNPSKDNVMAADDVHVLSKVTEFVPTGCLPLDIIMGGGAPIGRMIEIYGDNSTGKSVLGEQFLRQCQLMGGVSVLLDTEVALSDDVSAAIGINRKELIYSTPETVEECWEIITSLVEIKDQIDPKGLMTIVWDSVAGTSSKAELERVKKEGLNTRGMAETARLMSQMGRMLPNLISKKRIAMVLINQTRENIGVMFGEEKSTTGGRAIGYYATVRIELSGAGKIATPEKVVTGINVRALVTKNKCAPPFGRCVFPILFGSGIDEPGALFEWLKTAGLITVSGAWQTISINGQDVRFQRPGWPKIVIENDQAIRQLLLEHAGYRFEIEEDEVE